MMKGNLEKRSRRLNLVLFTPILSLLIWRSLRLKPLNTLSARLTYLLSRRVMCAMHDDPGLLADHHSWIRVLAMAAAAATARFLGCPGSARVGAKDTM